MMYLRCLLIIVSSIGLADFAMAEELSVADQSINTTVSDFVRRMMSDTSSDLYSTIRAMMLGFAFIGTAWHVMLWAANAIEKFDLVLYMLTCVIIFTIYANFDAFMSELWSWSDGIGLAFQQEAVGSRDPIFIGSQIRIALDNLFTEDLDLWDGINVIGAVLSFKFISLLLSGVIFIVSMWSAWGYAFMKITGLLFLPLLFLPITQGVFQKWFQIFLGFWFFNLFSKIALSLYHLYFFSIVHAQNDPQVYDAVVEYLTMRHLTLHFFMGILFMLAMAGFASAMSSGFNGIASRSSRAMQQIASQLMKKF